MPGQRKTPLKPVKGKIPAPVLILHQPEETRGRRNRFYPQVNIRETAATMGINESHLSNLLSGKTYPSLRMARKLSQLFQTSIDEVLAIYDDQRNSKSISLQKRRRFSLPTAS